MKKLSRCLLAIFIVCLTTISLPEYARGEDMVHEFTTLAGKTGRIALPGNYTPLPWGAIFTSKDPYAALSIDNLDIEDAPPGVCNTFSFHREFLTKKKESMVEGEAVFEEEDPFFGIPTLIVTRASTDTTTGAPRKIKDIRFVKDCQHFIITFACDADYFDAQWQDIEQRIRNIEFLE